MADERLPAWDSDPVLSVVTPMYNESAGLTAFAEELRPVLDALGCNYEVVLVDDGSTDGSAVIAASWDWPQCRIVQLTRNVGHQVALEAGMDLARGAYVLTMDSDGQHPCGEIPAMMAAVQSTGADVVYMRRPGRENDGFAKRTAALGYYHLARLLTGIELADSQADFRLVSARVIDDLRGVSGDKVYRLLLPSVGYSSVTLDYQTRPRIAGEGRFGVGRQVRLATSTFLEFSSKPLRIVASLGIVLSLAAFVWLIAVLVTFVSTRTVSGWASLMTAMLLVGGLTLLSLSIVGEYVARIHDLLKGHPRYSVRKVLPED